MNAQYTVQSAPVGLPQFRPESQSKLSLFSDTDGKSADHLISLSGYYTVSSPTSLRREEARPGGANEVEWSVYLGLLCMLRVPLHYSHLKRTVVTHTGLSHDVTNTDS